jgi:hypothetical protein
MGLSPAESNREQAFERRVQVAVQVEVASPGVVVEQPAVELDDQPERLVDDVAEDRPPRRSPDLPLRPGEPVCTLDERQEVVLEERA